MFLVLFPHSQKNVCVELMCPVERKMIKGWAKEAGVAEDELKAAVDMEMKMLMVKSATEQRDMMVSV